MNLMCCFCWAGWVLNADPLRPSGGDVTKQPTISIHLSLHRILKYFVTFFQHKFVFNIFYSSARCQPFGIGLPNFNLSSLTCATQDKKYSRYYSYNFGFLLHWLKKTVWFLFVSLCMWMSVSEISPTPLDEFCLLAETTRYICNSVIMEPAQLKMAATADPLEPSQTRAIAPLLLDTLTWNVMW